MYALPFPRIYPAVIIHSSRVQNGKRDPVDHFSGLSRAAAVGVQLRWPRGDSRKEQQLAVSRARRRQDHSSRRMERTAQMLRAAERIRLARGVVWP